MIDPEMATYIVCSFIIIFALIVPTCAVIPKLKEIISYRWLVVVTYLAITIGVIVDFEHLDDTVRGAVILGGAVLSGLFIVLRSIEKGLYMGWLGGGRVEASVEKGDAKAKVSYIPDKPKEEHRKEKDDLCGLAERENQ